MLKKSSGRAQLIIPKLDTRIDDKSHEVRGVQEVDKGDLNQIMWVVRPGLMIDGKVKLKADIIISQ